MAQAQNTVVVNGVQVDFDAAVNLMDDDLREEINTSWAGSDDDHQGFVDAYVIAHAAKFDGEEFVVN